MAKKLNQIILKGILVLLLFGIWFQFVDVPNVLYYLQNISIVNLFPPFILITLNIIIGAFITREILKTRVKTSVYYLTKITIIGSIFSLITPMNGGGLLRAFLIKSKYKKPFKVIFGLLLLEFIIDTLITFIVGICAFFYFSFLLSITWRYILYSLVIFSMLLVLVVKPQTYSAIVKYVLPDNIYKALLKRFGEMWSVFSDFSELSKARLLWVSFYFAAQQLLSGLFLYYILLSINIDRNVFSVIFANSLFSVLSFIPSLPAKLGHMELAGLAAFVIPLHITASQAGAVTLIIRMVSITHIILSGIIVSISQKDEIDMVQILKSTSLSKKFFGNS